MSEDHSADTPVPVADPPVAGTPPADIPAHSLTASADAPRPWLATLLRLWVLMPVRSLPSHGALTASSVMGVAWLCLWVAIDHWQSGPDPQFIPAGIPLLSWYALAVLALAALLRWRSRPTPAFAAVLALALGVVPLPLVFLGVAAGDLSTAWFWGAGVAVGLHALLFLARGLRAVTGRTQGAGTVAGLVFIVGFVWLTDGLDAIPDVWTPRESQAAEPADAADDAEAILFSQAGRIDHALAAVRRETSPRPAGFFLGFAGVGEQKVFTQEIGLASRVLGERYGMTDRSISLINDQRDLERAPLATVSGLTYALRGLALRMNPDRDVLFLAISSHGAEDATIAVSNSQLPLMDLTDEDLADALRESGIKWRVIIISACYAGAFIDSLRNPQTIVITAAAADRTSFGCSNDSDLTYFGEAFYRDALPAARSLREAFNTAKAAIAARERAEHETASNPQAFFGKELEARLASFEAP